MKNESIWQLFPRNLKPTEDMYQVIACINKNYLSKDSSKNQLSSNEVLSLLSQDIEKLGYDVECGKTRKDKIEIPVLYGTNGGFDKFFCADAYSPTNRIVIEVEAGRAYTNNQFLKDLFQACVMDNVDYLILVVRKTYNKHPDFEKIYAFLETLYVTNKLILPLKGILLIGY